MSWWATGSLSGWPMHTDRRANRALECADGAFLALPIQDMRAPS